MTTMAGWVRRYAEQAIDGEIDDLRSATGDRNPALNKAALAVAAICAGAEREGVEFSQPELQAKLFAAAQANGYVQKDGASQAWATIKSGFGDGLKSPRDLSKVGRANGHAQPKPAREAPPPPPPPHEDKPDPDELAKLRRATAIFGSGELPRDNPGGVYLKEARGIPLDGAPDLALRDVHYVEACPTGVGLPGERTLPAIVVRLRSRASRRARSSARSSSLTARAVQSTPTARSFRRSRSAGTAPTAWS